MPKSETRTKRKRAPALRLSVPLKQAHGYLAGRAKDATDTNCHEIPAPTPKQLAFQLHGVKVVLRGGSVAAKNIAHTITVGDNGTFTRIRPKPDGSIHVLDPCRTMPAVHNLKGQTIPLTDFLEAVQGYEPESWVFHDILGKVYQSASA